MKTQTQRMVIILLDCPFQTNSESCMDNHIKQTKHMSRHNKETVEDYICKKCGTECETGKELRVHMGGHTGDQQCDFCNIKFMTRHLLRRHMRYNHNINIEDSYKIQKMIHMIWNIIVMTPCIPKNQLEIHHFILVDSVKKYLKIRMK